MHSKLSGSINTLTRTCGNMCTILELQEKGEIQMLYDKWWKNAGETCVRKDKTKQSKANALGLDNIGGIFLVLLCGLIVAVCMSVYEYCQYNKKATMASSAKGTPGSAVNYGSTHSTTVGVQQTLCDEMINEFYFALRCMGPRKRPALKRQCSKCTSTARELDQMQMPFRTSRATSLGDRRLHNEGSSSEISVATTPHLDMTSTGNLLDG